MDWEVVGLLVLFLKVAGDAVLAAAACATGLFSLAFALTSGVAAWKFFRLRARPPEGELPAVTILKPLKGVDRELYECLKSFCRLDYPRFQLLFTLASPEDPALAVLSRLRQEFPAVDMEIVVSKARVGFNPKVNNMANAAPFIKHDVLLMSDSDVKVRPQFLRRAVAYLADPEVGMVTSFYQSTSPREFWARLESLSVNAQFLPQAVTAAAFGMRFAMGACMLIRRPLFEQVGGFSLMAGHLADDFILGQAVLAAGKRLEIAGEVVEATPDIVDAVSHLSHQARWARTIRLCQPEGHVGTLVLHGFSLLTLKLALFGWDARAAALLAGIWAAKAAAKQSIAVLSGNRQSAVNVLLLPLSEWVSFLAWLSAFRGGPVLWRGELYTVESRGKLVPARRPVFDLDPGVVEP